MAINFPNSPSNGATHTAAGQTFTYDGTAGVWNPQEGTPVSTGTSAPSNPSPGDLWFDTADGTLYFYYADGSSNQWVGVSGPAGAMELMVLMELQQAGLHKPIFQPLEIL